MKDPLRRRARAAALDALVRACGPLPPAVIEGALAVLAGAARWTRYERLVLRQLEEALGDQTSAAERRRIARGVRRHTARIVAEWIRLARGAPPEGPGAERGCWIDEVVELDPTIERLDAALAAGRGAIVATAHLGSWDLLAARLRRRGHRGVVVGHVRPRDPVSRWLVAMRAAYGVETVPQHSHPRVLLETLRGGDTVGLLCDLEVRRLAGVHLPFFGRPALTMTAPAALARASGAPLVPVRCVACGPRRYRLSVEEPFQVPRRGDRRAATLAALRRLNETFERWIRETPEQWAWHQPRWRVLPAEGRTSPSKAP